MEVINLKLDKKRFDLLNSALSMAVGFSQEEKTTKEIEDLIGYILTESERPKTGAELIADERDRQITVEGFTPDKDKGYLCSELSDAAIMYAMRDYWKNRLPAEFVGDDKNPGWIWPFHADWWKPSDDRIRNLQKAGALIAAEIDRLQNLKKEG